MPDWSTASTAAISTVPTCGLPNGMGVSVMAGSDRVRDLNMAAGIRGLPAGKADIHHAEHIARGNIRLVAVADCSDEIRQQVALLVGRIRLGECMNVFFIGAIEQV